MSVLRLDAADERATVLPRERAAG